MKKVGGVTFVKTTFLIQFLSNVFDFSPFIRWFLFSIFFFRLGFFYYYSSVDKILCKKRVWHNSCEQLDVIQALQIRITALSEYTMLVLTISYNVMKFHRGDSRK